MGSAGKRQQRSHLVVNARFEHLWKVFFGLALSGKLPNVFDSRNLVGLECADFSEITQVNIFLQAAVEKNRLHVVGNHSPRRFKISVEPRLWLPERVKRFADKNNFQVVVKKLADCENPVTLQLTADDVQLAIFTLSEIVVDKRQLEILVKIYIEEGVIEQIDEKFFKITQLAEQKYLTIINPIPKIILTENDVERCVLDILNKLFSLFWMHRSGLVFEDRFSVRFKSLGFKNKKEMVDAFGLLEECDMLIKHTRCGKVVKNMWKWNLVNVPSRWRESVK